MSHGGSYLLAGCGGDVERQERERGKREQPETTTCAGGVVGVE